METIKLLLDKKNEMVFDVVVEGEISSSPIARLMIEGTGISYVFNGEKTEEGVQVAIPPLKENLKPGKYNSKLEVIIDDRIFTPMKFIADFEKVTSVVAEGVRVKAPQANEKPKIQVKARTIQKENTVSKKPTPKKRPVQKPKVKSADKELIKELLRDALKGNLSD